MKSEQNITIHVNLKVYNTGRLLIRGLLSGVDDELILADGKDEISYVLHVRCGGFYLYSMRHLIV